MRTERVILVGPPRSGKSTLARQLANGRPIVFCGDPRSKAKEPLPDVTYLPEGIPIAGDDGAAAWIVEHWFPMPGPWVCEGWVMARALRRWRRAHAFAMPCDRIIVLLNQHQHAVTLKGQESMAKAVRTVWEEIAPRFDRIAEYR